MFAVGNGKKLICLITALLLLCGAGFADEIENAEIEAFDSVELVDEDILPASEELEDEIEPEEIVTELTEESVDKKARPFTITYELNGGVNNEENPIAFAADEEIVLLTPERTGYTFAGWFTAANFKTGIEIIPIGTEHDVTVYAKWTVNSYVVVFDGNGAVNQKIYKQNCVYDAYFYLSDNKYALNGYVFSGWNTEANGEGEQFTNKQKVKNICPDPSGFITLYAQWKPVSYNISYVLNGSTNAAENPVTYTILDEFSFAEPVIAGYTFGGWYLDSRLTKRIEGIEPGRTGNITLYSKWTANSYTIVYDGNGAVNCESYKQACTYGKELNLTDNKFSMPGYTFIGWTTDLEDGRLYGNRQKVKNLCAEQDAVITLYARWRINTYKIDYRTNGGTNASENPATYTVEDSFIIAEPTCTGYTFQGWYLDSNFKKPISEIEAGMTGNITLFAKWTVNTYTIVFAGNGATNVETYECVSTYNREFNLPDNRFVRLGYTFMGWKEEGEDGKAYANKQRVKNLRTENGATITLNAQWKINTYKIAYAMNGGTNAEGNPSTYTVLDNIVLEDPTRPGYTFAGWFTDGNFKKPISEIAVGTAVNINLYAKWNVNTYTIVFTGNGATNVETYERVSAFNSEFNLPDNRYVRLGYTFMGWKEEGEDGKAYANKQRVKNLRTENGATITFNAQWKINTYKIAYAMNGGTNAAGNPSTYTVLDNIVLEDPTRPGYTFAGWFTDSNFKKPISEIAAGTAVNINLYAKWNVNTYTIVFTGNGATNVETYERVSAFNTEFNLPDNRYVRPGYTFMGWKEEGEDGKTYANKQRVKNLRTENGATITLCAQWKINTYKIAYAMNGGTNAAGNPSTYTVLDNIVLEDPTRPGYTFAGWFTDSNFKKPISEIAAGTAVNINLYTKWNVNTYTIVFTGNGATNVENYERVSAFNTEFALPDNRFVRPGYTFTGWKEEGENGKTYANKQRVKNLRTENGATVTLCAQWKINSYKIAYAMNGGTNAAGNPSTFTVLDNIVLENPIRPGYTFAGWYSDSSFKKPITEIAAGTAVNINLYAKWNVNTYTIVFTGNGATNVETYERVSAFNTEFALPDNRFMRPGYTFAGWKEEGENGKTYANKQRVKNLRTENGATVTLCAQWKINTYKIAYAMNGGTNAAGNPSTFTVLDNIVLENPIRPGYTFAGWYSDSSFKKPITEIAAGTAVNINLYAKWNVNTYTIVFTGNGATNVETYERVSAFNTEFALPDNRFVRPGYTFTGWKEEGEGGKTYANKQRVKNLRTENGATVTLCAQWKINTYKIAYAMNGGTNAAGNPSTFTVLDNIVFENPVRTGYTFEGWYSDSSFKKPITEIVAGMSSNITVYAKWRVNSYKIVFDGNGASNTETYERTCIFNNEFSLPDTRFTLTGYTFAGWKSSADGKIYANKQRVKNLCSEDGETVTFYAQWKTNTYKIAYVLNGGINATENPASYTVVDSIEFAIPTRVGYTFAGWYTDGKFQNAITGIDAGRIGNITIYAKWNVNSYTVTFNGNGAENMGTYSQLFTYGNEAALMINGFTREYYGFAGWNTKPDGTGVAYRDRQKVKSLTAEPDTVIELYAQWKPLVRFPEYVEFEKQTIKIGEGDTIKTAVRIDDGAVSPFTFASSDTSVVTVDGDGSITGVCVGGPVEITVTTINSKTATCSVTVKKAPTAITFDSAISVHSLSEASVQLNWSLGSKDEYGRISFTSSDTHIAEVNSRGLVTFKATGEVDITAETYNGKKDVRTLKIGNAPESVAFEKESFVIGEGDTVLLPAVFENGCESYTLACEDESIAIVSGNDVKGVSEGETRVVLTTSSGLQCSCMVVVQAVSGTLQFAEENIELVRGGNSTCYVTAAYEGFDLTGCTYYSSDTDIVTVNSRTGQLRIAGFGTCTVIAVSFNGDSAECSVTTKGILQGKKIGIDPGHQAQGNLDKECSSPSGGAWKYKVSYGGSGAGVKEYVTNLDVGLKLRDMLEYLGAEVVMARTTHDVDISNQERAKMMNEAGVDLWLRLHCNSGGSLAGTVNFVRQSVLWSSEYVSDPTSLLANEYRLSKCLVDRMCELTGFRNLGTKRSNDYTGNNWSLSPCVLVEMGFNSNYAEAKKLIDPYYQYRLSLGMTNGICEYFGIELPNENLIPTAYQ